MELALAAGAHILRSLFSNNNEKYDNKIRIMPSLDDHNIINVYDTIKSKELEKDYYDKGNILTQKSKHAERTNIIPAYYNQLYNDNNTNKIHYGPMAESELLIKDNIDMQFNLQKIDTKEPLNNGEYSNLAPFDRSKNIIKEDFTHNNMHTQNAYRDSNPEESNNFEYKMDIYAGSSKYWNPKTEVLPFFDPSEKKENPFGTSLTVDTELERMVKPLNKQNERPFEPTRISVGLNLDYNAKSNSGKFDLYRPDYTTTDNLRIETKPKLTYEGRQQAAPLKYIKRQLDPKVIKRNPIQWKYQDVDDFVANKSTVTKQLLQGKYIIDDNSRMYTSTEIKGNANAVKLVGPSNKNGDVRINRKIKHIEDKLGPNCTNKHNSNIPSYNIIDNDRNTTNYNINMPGVNLNQGNKYYNSDDIAKPTLKENLSMFNTMIGQLNGSISTLTDEAKFTIKQIISTQKYNQILTSHHHNVYSNLSDKAKNTLKEILTLCEFNTNLKSNNGLYTNNDNIANNTLKEIYTLFEFNTNLSSHNKQLYSNLEDLPKNTLKETLTDKQLNTYIKSLLGSTSNLTDLAKNTLKEKLSNAEFSTNFNANKTVISNFTDNAKITTTQTLSNNKFNTNLTGYNNVTNLLNDKAKNTLKEGLSNSEFSTNFNANKTVISNFTDNAKMTIMQTLSNNKFNTNLTGYNNVTNSLTDMAQNTLKETVTNNKFNTNLTGFNNVTNPLMDMAQNTLKETMTNNKFNTNLTAYNNVTNHLTDTAQHTIKETVTNNKFNTNLTGYNNVTNPITDMAQNTLKETVTNNKFNTNLTGFNNVTNPLSDMAQHTLKETVTNSMFNNNLRNKPGTYNMLNDKAKTTFKEILSVLDTNKNCISIQKNPYANLSDSAKHTLKELIVNYKLNNNIGNNIKSSYCNITDNIKTTLRDALTIMEFNNNMGISNKPGYSNLQDNAKKTNKELFTTIEFNNYIKQTISTYSSLSDQAKNTIREILVSENINNMININRNGIYSNLSDLAKNTVKQILALKVYNTNINNTNKSSYSNISDDAKQTLRELLVTLDNNQFIQSLNKESYSQLMDIAKDTIKQYISSLSFNNNINSIHKKDLYINYDDVARTTHKQSLLNENYISHMNNSSNGIIQETYDIPETMKDLNKIYNYNNTGLSYQKPRSYDDSNNMYQNISKEIIAKGVDPTLSGPKQIPTTDNQGSIELKNIPYTELINNGSLINNHIVDFNMDVKNKVFYNERLYHELLDSIKQNDLVNNIVF